MSHSMHHMKALKTFRETFVDMAYIFSPLAHAPSIRYSRGHTCMPIGRLAIFKRVLQSTLDKKGIKKL